MLIRSHSPLVKVFAPFALAGLVATLIAIVVAVEIKHRQLDAAATEFGRAAVETVATALSDTIWPEIRAIVVDVENLSEQALAERPEVAAVAPTIERFARNTDIVAIKIFDLAGRTIYAPVAADLGRRSSSPEAIQSALEGRVATTLYADRVVNGFDGPRRFDRIVTSYAPIRASNGRVEAVFEFFFDASRTSATIHNKLLVFEYGIAALLVGLYAAMTAVVWQTTRVQARQHAEMARTADERLAAMDALAKERERFADFSEIAAGWVWETDPEHCFSYVSESFRSLGVDPAWRIGRHPAGWDTKNGVDGNEPTLGETMRRHEPFRDRIVHVALPDRASIWVARSGKPIFGAAGQFLGYRGADRNITRRINAENHLRLSNRVQADLLASLEDVRARLELALETGALGWWEFDGASGLQVWSARTRAIYGVDAATPASYERFQQLLHPEDRATRIDLTLRPAGRGVHSYRIVASDGSIRYLREDYMIERRPSGELVRVFGTLLDMSDIERLRRDAERARATLDSALDSMAEGFLLCDAEDRVVAANRKVREMFAATIEAPLVPGARFTDVLAAKLAVDMGHLTAPEREAYLHQCLAHRQTPNESVVFVDAGGTIIEVFEARGPDGSIVSLYRDITKERRAANDLASAKNAAEEANRAKTRFLATMSHEIRTPMNGVLGMAELLAGTALDKQQGGYVAVIERSVSALLAIIDDILDYSKLEAGEMRLERGIFDPVDLVEETVALMSAMADKKGLALTVNAAQDVPRALTGDATRVRQVLLNLLGNAIKFTQAGSVTATLATGQCASGAVGVVFLVADTGIGIAPDAVDRLFERFSQADETIARRFGGTGLGLAISRELARLMDGDLSVESVPGVGSTFRFVIPLCAIDAGAPRTPDALQAPLVPAATASLDLLVAEDNDVNRLVVGEMLARMGHRYEFVFNGVQAVAKARTKRFDAILMDAQMPEMDGDEATRQIRLLPAPFGKVPIVALTANAMSGDRELYLAAGMNEYVSKPVRAAELAAALARATGLQVGA
jgi:signal transduction histidine kinase/ActR/RegA family two-component response regulator